MRIWLLGGLLGIATVSAAACDPSDEAAPSPDDASTSSGSLADGSTSSGSSSSSSSGFIDDGGEPDPADGSPDPADADAAAPTCVVDGVSFAAGIVNPKNACESCIPDTNATGWTAQADETSCGADSLCRSGACIAGCTIAGTFYPDGTPNPANGCEKCDVDVATSVWSPGYRVLLEGGIDVAAQGWSVVSVQPSVLSYGLDYTRLSTSTTQGARTSGQLLLRYPEAVTVPGAFRLRTVLQVEAVNSHNSLDSGAAILGSFTSPFGNAVDRSQMIYLDATRVGWSDDTASAAVAVLDGAYHVYELVVDATGAATFSVDGVQKLTRANFSRTGQIALGDQTNDPNVDGAMRIKSVAVCMP